MEEFDMPPTSPKPRQTVSAMRISPMPHTIPRQVSLPVDCVEVVILSERLALRLQLHAGAARHAWNHQQAQATEDESETQTPSTE